MFNTELFNLKFDKNIPDKYTFHGMKLHFYRQSIIIYMPYNS